jgi:hypothetical protein
MQINDQLNGMSQRVAIEIFCTTSLPLKFTRLQIQTFLTRRPLHLLKKALISHHLHTPTALVDATISYGASSPLDVTKGANSPHNEQ